MLCNKDIFQLRYSAFIPQLLAIHNQYKLLPPNSLNNKLLFTLSKADRVTHKALYSIWLENRIRSNNWLETISMIFLTLRFKVCCTNIFQGPNLPGTNMPGLNLPRLNMPGPNIPLKIARGPICLEPKTFTK